ncbi:MAG: YdeI/OmpD-associated family protein [Acidimicrobiaceae bacterium]|nr:YdeI/OmpD-associated family protein [Acidimicrobiaceae bacterium]MCY3651061.1 YdeI/OmpD-associated family protein [Acidimicrobiaceae bacterium]MDE0516006.1 YdeI/OmpD-associated family protein [Acidimicrobiaceae bacterium]MDE0657366.1 YdeI/OmpD-associated family protein [Acidimicrobiaceae bacterium]
MRPVLLRTGLTEEFKWRSPCYSHGGKNIVIVQDMRNCLALMFFKGALLADPDGVFVDHGPNSRSARRIEFTSVDDVTRLADTVRAYIDDAVSVEELGLKVGPHPALVLVEELQNRLEQDPALKAAFEALTPGRQREYNVHVSGAKQAKTREARIDRYAPKILAGKGLRDR